MTPITVEKPIAEATVDGKTLDVMRARVILAVNDIPTVELLCAPDDIYVDMSDTAKEYRKLAQKAERRDVSVDVTVYVADASKDNHGGPMSMGFELRGWILVGAGMSSLSATGAPVLSVVAQHPICLLSSSGAIYEDPKSNLRTKIGEAVADKRNILEIFSAAYDVVADGNSLFHDIGSDAVKELRRGLKDRKPEKYLEYGEGVSGLFPRVDGSEEGFASCQAKAMGELVFGGASTWDSLLDAMGDLMLTVVQDGTRNYTRDRLLLEPMDPWKLPTLTLRAEDCTSTSLPGMDPAMVSGAVAQCPSPLKPKIDQGIREKDREKLPKEYVSYIPDAAKGRNGRIIKTTAPSVLLGAFMYDTPHGDNLSAGVSYLKEEWGRKYNAATERYCRALYEISAAAMSQATATMALMTHDVDNGIIVPGQSCVFTSGGTEIYCGYIRRVEHNISSNGRCWTSVSMSHVRPERDFKIGEKTAISAGQGNAAYRK